MAGGDRVRPGRPGVPEPPADGMSRAEYRAREGPLREALLDTQFELRERSTFPVILMLGGADGSGKAQVLHRLYEWLEVHYLQTHAFGPPTRDERSRPRFWRYWQVLPPKGRIGVIYGSWYHEPLERHVNGELDASAFDGELDAIAGLESMLAADGALILKIWLHLSHEQHLERMRGRRRTRRVVMAEWNGLGKAGYERLLAAGERMRRATGTDHAPWHVVAAADDRHRDLAVGGLLLEAMRARMQRPAFDPAVTPSPVPVHVPGFDDVDLAQRLDKERYGVELDRWQRRLARLVARRRFDRASAVLVFEGNDAAGKGGAIRRVTQALDPRRFRVHPISAPGPEEAAQPYLWRFWRRLPGPGHLAVFDRSWYGRVLVERVEALCSAGDWARAYEEINAFETQLRRARCVVVKFWLAINRDEQLRRFRAREAVPHKRFKLKPSDWRNNERWDDYHAAARDMIARTGTATSPWTVVAAQDKRHARIQVLRTLCERLEQEV